MLLITYLDISMSSFSYSALVLVFLFHFYSYSGQSLVVNDVFPPILSKICESDSDEIESDYSDDDSVTN